VAKPADNLREAVERTVDATMGSAERIGRRLDAIEERLPKKRAGKS
jgi:hypothetical protein